MGHVGEEERQYSSPGLQTPIELCIFESRKHKNEDEHLPTESRVVKQVLFAVPQRCKQTALV